MVVCLQENLDGGVSVVRDQSLCALSEKPAIQQPCSTEKCNGVWHFTEWTKVRKLEGYTNSMRPTFDRKCGF